MKESTLLVSYIKKFELHCIRPYLTKILLEVMALTFQVHFYCDSKAMLTTKQDY